MLVLAGGASQPSIKKLRGKQTVRSFKRKVTRKVGYRYLFYLPGEYSPATPLPLMLFLHGAGERGSNIRLVKKHGPPKLISQGKSFPFIVVAPQCPAGQWWQAEELNALLDEIVEGYAVDTARIYVTGLSMGGFGTWTLGVTYPERFAALAPVCGWGEPFAAFRLRDMPVWAFHGAKDPIVPLSKGQEMIDALKRAGGSPRFTIYPEAEHDSWTETYENPGLYSWLLQRHR
ncbi:MAG: Alpha/beta hydrolase family protein [Bacteroidetes bacterium]|jgi:predicted peptidase|nr:Alpha/beta hydrolase family protein [Bacteroidota bacterium]